MSQTSNIIGYLEAGIKAESLKQRAIANNIANLETPGYRRMGVRFEKQLAKALKSGSEIDWKEIEPELYRPKDTPVSSNGNDVQFEQEVSDMVKNNLRHEAFVRLLKKKYTQMELAINVK